MGTAGIIILIALAALLLFGVIPTMAIAVHVFRQHLVRPGKDAWNRGVCGFPDNEENAAMFLEGMEWFHRNEDCAREVSVESDGLHLCGQYFDFGFTRSVIILAGRAEALTYSYYFAEPYRDFGYNVLVIDNRATGLSDGRVNCTGLKEYRDLQAWIRLLHEGLGNETVLLHGICIGACTSMLAVTDENCPPCVEGLVTDGMFTTFAETFRTHMIELGRPVFPVCMECMLLLHLVSGRSPYRTGPLYAINRLKLPILMIYGREDRFSLPEKSQMLYDMCPSDKTIAWFEKGSHSHLRCNARERYDDVIGAFIRSHFDGMPGGNV